MAEARVRRVWESKEGRRLEVKVTAALPTHGFLCPRHLHRLVQDTTAPWAAGH